MQLAQLSLMLEQGRSGFAELAAQVGLGQVGIVLALEVSRLARNNADWYRLLDLAGAYVYGRTKFERRPGDDGQIRTRRRVLPREQWQVLIEDHHRGYLDWDTYLASTEKIATNTRPVRHEPGTGAVREGCALLQGLAACGICGRKLAVFYQGPSKTTPGYYCTGPARSSRAGEPDTCSSAGSPSTPLSPARSWPRWPRPRCPRAWPPSRNSNTATTPP